MRNFPLLLASLATISSGCDPNSSSEILDESLVSETQWRLSGFCSDIDQALESDDAHIPLFEFNPHNEENAQSVGSLNLTFLEELEEFRLNVSGEWTSPLGLYENGFLLNMHAAAADIQVTTASDGFELTEIPFDVIYEEEDDDNIPISGNVIIEDHSKVEGSTEPTWLTVHTSITANPIEMPMEPIHDNFSLFDFNEDLPVWAIHSLSNIYMHDRCHQQLNGPGPINSSDD